MRVAMLVDHPKRDLPGLVLVALRLCQAGARCFLVPMNLPLEIWSLAPDVLLANYVRPNNQVLLRNAMRAGIAVGVLDTEGGVFSNLESYRRTLAPNPRVRDGLAFVCTWGTALADYLALEGIFRPDQIRVTGSPRYDFYAEPFKLAAIRSSPFADRLSRPLVLFNGNFPVANPRFQSTLEEARFLEEVLGHDAEEVAHRQRGQQETLEALTRLVNDSAQRFPNVTFVYRPHPFEGTEIYRNLLDERPNLHLVKEGTVDGWILRSSAVVQRACSTAIESGLANVPALSPSWIPTATEMPTAEEVSVQCEHVDVFRSTLDDVLAGSYELPPEILTRLTRVVRNWFFDVDGRSHERVAEAILSVTPSPRARLERRCKQYAYGRGRGHTTAAWRARSVVARSLRLPVHWSFTRWRSTPPNLTSWETTEKAFSVSEVRHLVESTWPSFNNTSGMPARNVSVDAAAARGDYRFGFDAGRSVVLEARDANV